MSGKKRRERVGGKNALMGKGTRAWKPALIPPKRGDWKKQFAPDKKSCGRGGKGETKHRRDKHKILFKYRRPGLWCLRGTKKEPSGGGKNSSPKGFIALMGKAIKPIFAKKRGGGGGGEGKSTTHQGGEFP